MEGLLFNAFKLNNTSICLNFSIRSPDFLSLFHLKGKRIITDNEAILVTDLAGTTEKYWSVFSLSTKQMKPQSFGGGGGWSFQLHYKSHIT